MKRVVYFIIILISTSLLFACSSKETIQKEEENMEEEIIDINQYQGKAVYLGTKDYGKVDATSVLSDGNQVYCFQLEDQTYVEYAILNDQNYSIQNQLMRGYDYIIQVKDQQVISVELQEERTSSITTTIQGIPGKRTLKNLLQIAFEPLGKVLYVYGGGWNFQDTAGSIQANSIGIAQSWIDFKSSQDDTYEYRNDQNHIHTTYPFGGYNEYYYAGLDCSGYIGWILYNTLNNGNNYVDYACNIAGNLANQQYGYLIDPTTPLQAGDIISMSGHIWMCLGVCNDGSILLIHSTTGGSISNHIGGGVQLSVLSKNNSSDCEAYQIAYEFMSTYYSDWINDYPVLIKNYDQYMNRVATFRWYLDARGLEDQENISLMDPREVLKNILR